MPAKSMTLPAELPHRSTSVWGYALMVALAWTAAIGFMLVGDIVREGQATLQSARAQARMAYEKDVLYRRWVAEHGGVYVEVTDRTPPNPYLVAPERDILTPSGRKLTLINPAYMTREVMELTERTVGLRGHLTSLHPLRPENAADPWEQASLAAFARGEKERSTVEERDGRRYLRLMRPLMTEKSCLACHASGGDAAGDVRGGISVAVDLAPLEAIAAREMRTHAMTHAALWLVGLGATGIVARMLNRRIAAQRRAEVESRQYRERLEELMEKRTAALRDSEARYQAIVGAAADAIISFDAAGTIESFNLAAEGIFGVAGGDILGGNVSRLVADEAAGASLAAALRACDDESTGVAGCGCMTLARRHDGAVFPVEFAVSRHELAGKRMYTAIIRDVTEREAADREIRRLAGGLESAGEAIVLTDLSGTIQYVNPAFTRLSGYTAEEVVGRNPRLISSHRYSTEQYRKMWQTILRGKVWRGELINRRKDGTTYDAQLTIAPIRSASGEIDGFVGVQRDISQQKRIEEELRQAKEAAEGANRAKSEFLAIMSHELRTPLNAIIGFSEMMIADKKDPPDARHARRLEKIHRNGRALLGLINDILDLSKIDAERMKLDREEVAVGALLRECLESVKPLVDGANVELRLCLDSRLEKDSIWIGDEARLRQIVMNLLGNAAKFTEKGSIVLRAGAVEDLLRIEVEDTGIGIAAEHLAVIFDEFRQVDGSSNRRAGGTGLGLAICRRLCTLLRGEITVTSTVGEGSCFVVILPMIAVEAAEEGEERGSTGPATKPVVEASPAGWSPE